jgi:hypothetical protein
MSVVDQSMDLTRNRRNHLPARCVATLHHTD